jgi:hypothetical protein
MILDQKLTQKLPSLMDEQLKKLGLGEGGWRLVDRESTCCFFIKKNKLVKCFFIKLNKGKLILFFLFFFELEVNYSFDFYN